MSSSTAARRGGGGPTSILFCDPLELAVEVGLFRSSPPRCSRLGASPGSRAPCPHRTSWRAGRRVPQASRCPNGAAGIRDPRPQ
eukprot:16177-Heterocapsa_arctica.AAC.1